MTACMILSIGAFFIPVSQAGLIFAISAMFGLIMPVLMVTVTSLLVEEGHEYKDRCAQGWNIVLIEFICHQMRNCSGKWYCQCDFSYAKHLEFHTYDITEMMGPGKHGAILILHIATNR